MQLRQPRRPLLDLGHIHLISHTRNDFGESQSHTGDTRGTTKLTTAVVLGGSSLTWKASSVLECAGGGRTRATAALLITGTVGSGKTTVAETISELLVERGMTHAVVDLDQLRLSWPPPVGDRFSYALELANLRAVAANYWATERFGSFWRA